MTPAPETQTPRIEGNVSTMRQFFPAPYSSARCNVLYCTKKAAWVDGIPDLPLAVEDTIWLCERHASEMIQLLPEALLTRENLEVLLHRLSSDKLMEIHGLADTILRAREETFPERDEEPEIEPGEFLCPYCDEVLPTQVDLDLHLETHSLDRKPDEEKGKKKKKGKKK